MTAERPGIRLARGLLLTIASVYPVVFLVVTWLRIRHPFGLEFLEGSMLVGVERVLAGEPLYVAPSLHYVSLMYTPLYYYAGAAVAVLLGPSLFSLRLVSVFSTVVCFGIIQRIVRRHTGSGHFGWIAACLFAASYAACGSWFDVARVDMLFLALFLAAVLLLHRPSTAAWMAAGLFFFLAFLAKQSALVMVLPILLYAFQADRRRAAWLAGTLVAAIGLSTWIGDHATAGWYSRFIFELPRGSYDRVDQRILTFWTRDLLGVFPAALLASVAYLGWVLGQAVKAPSGARDQQSLLLLAATLGLVGGSWGSRIHHGGYVNVLLPAYTALCITAPVAMQRTLATLRADAAGERSWLEPAVYALAIAQFGVLAFDPVRLVPTRASLEAGRRLVHAISEMDGDVLVAYEPILAEMAGKPRYAHVGALAWLSHSGDDEAKRDVVAAFNRAFIRRRFAGVIVSDDWLQSLEGFRNAYAPSERPILADPDVFWPVTGAQVRPDSLYLPRPGRARGP
jgi:hypothetical protein